MGAGAAILGLAMNDVCVICGGSGLRVVQEGGRQFAQDCVCRVNRRMERMLGQAHIPTAL